METLFPKLAKGLVLSMVVWATACSQVNFAPGVEDAPSVLEVPDGSQKETFSFDDDGAGAKVDVLFVVDNSGSMWEEQNRLGSALASFISSIGGIDWQIGITTTDVSDGPYGLKGSLLPFPGGSRVLTKNTPNYAAAFNNTVVRPELLSCDNVTVQCPSSDERPLQAAVLAMQKGATVNAGMFRPGADLAIVILSDEDEASVGGVDALAATAVVAAFRTVFGNGKSLSSYGLIIQPGDTTCYNQNSAGGGQYGTFAKDLSLLTGGVTGSICDMDYGPALTSIGNRVREMIKSVTLKHVPQPDTVQIVIRPFDSSLTWQIVGNQIIFSKPPKKGTVVDVVYLPK